jgi:hypothetical protein
LGFATLLLPKTVWHWEKVRLGTTGFRELFNESVWKNMPARNSHYKSIIFSSKRCNNKIDAIRTL